MAPETAAADTITPMMAETTLLSSSQTELPVPGVEVVDSEGAMLALLDNMSDLPSAPPPVYLDLEGVNLGRHGTISIISLYLRPQNKTYLIDVHTLDRAAFTITNGSVSLKTVLESPDISKVIFDVRNDCDALFSLYQIRLDGFQDLQLMEFITRSSYEDKKFLKGLARCIESHSSLPFAAKVAWLRTKNETKRLFKPAHGGRYEIFNDRPMSKTIIDYCTGDVVTLAKLYLVYVKRMGSLTPFKMLKVREETKNRITGSQHSNYCGQGSHKAYGPTSWINWDADRAGRQWMEGRPPVMME